MIRILLALSLALMLAVLALRAPTGEAAVGASVRTTARPAEAERARVAAHLERVESLLRAADVSHLSHAQRAARARQLDVLGAYRRAGEFPHNHVLRGRRTPVFVDGHGARCAVGHLLAESGEAALVERIAATRNLATVAQLADEPGLADWLERNGLTAEEAGLIQPWYGAIYDVSATHGGYATATVGLTALSAAASTWTLLSERTGDAWYVPAAAGVLSGAASLAWGIHGLGLAEIDVGPTGRIRRTPSDADVAFNFVAGAVAAALGTRALVLGRADAPRRADGAAPVHLEIAPAGGLVGAGVRATLRF